jgi:LysR family nitrogen assimilation transcriptional regulator
VDARQIEYFLRIVELGSINRAAADLRMSQPSLSRWLSILEHDVGTPLLIRTRQGIRVTDAGQSLMDRARPILRQLNILRDEIGKKASSQIVLAMPLSMERLVTAPFAERIAREHPHVTLRVYEGINNAIRQWMEIGAVDVAVMTPLEKAPESFRHVPLLREQLLLVGNREAALSLEKPIPLSALHNLELILPGRPNVISSLVENSLHRSGFNYCNRFEAEALSLCLELTRRGLGFTVMPYCALYQRTGRSDDLSAAPIRGLSVTWSLYLNRSREHAVSTRLLMDMLLQFVASTISANEWRFAQLISKSKPRK